MLESIKKMLLLGDSEAMAFVLNVLSDIRISTMTDKQIASLKIILDKAKNSG